MEGEGDISFFRDIYLNITSVLRNNRGTKVKIVFRCNMERMSKSGRDIQPAAFHSKIEINLDGKDEEELSHKMLERNLEKMATFQSRGSGWRLYSIIQLDIYTVKYNPTSGEIHIPVPKVLANKKAIINIKNTDNKCFYGVLRALYPGKSCVTDDHSFGHGCFPI